MAIVNTHYGYYGGSKAPKFTYTGTYNVRKDGVVELLTSGTIVFLNPATIDLFLVGGGGAGGSGIPGATLGGWGGGGGGYTTAVKAIPVSANASYSVVIGQGASGSAVDDPPGNGGATTFGNYSANGGKSPRLARASNDYTYGADGGSGGGGGRYSLSDGGAGGSDGAKGEAASGMGGSGQSSTTREFGEPGGKLYAAGGGGGTYISAQTPVYAPGGSGGGGAGAWGAGADRTQAAGAGGANTGGGGGGGVGVGGVANLVGGSGGSGIVCFRAAK